MLSELDDVSMVRRWVISNKINRQNIHIYHVASRGQAAAATAPSHQPPVKFEISDFEIVPISRVSPKSLVIHGWLNMPLLGPIFGSLGLMKD